jgi:hypothetical protein
MMRGRHSRIQTLCSHPLACAANGATKLLLAANFQQLAADL